MDYDKYEKYHWKLFNTLVRCIGFCFFVAGVFCVIWMVRLIIDPNLFYMDSRQKNIDYETFKIIGSFFSIASLLIGFFGMVVKLYYPKRIKDKNMQQHNKAARPEQ
jgi:hypothetical protein